MPNDYNCTDIHNCTTSCSNLFWLATIGAPSSSHQLTVTSIPTLTDNFFKDLDEGDKTDITDDDLALLSSPSLITYSDQSCSHYISDTVKPETLVLLNFGESFSKNFDKINVDEMLVLKSASYNK